jgi:hypothetical protein
MTLRYPTHSLLWTGMAEHGGVLKSFSASLPVWTRGNMDGNRALASAMILGSESHGNNDDIAASDGPAGDGRATCLVAKEGGGSDD